LGTDGTVYENEDDLMEEATKVNVTNQLIGEVQAFILVLRLMLYEFYQFKEYKKEGFIGSSDFEAIDEDLIFIIHKRVVNEDVNTILIVMSRMLNAR
jgi:hypothetical protein